MQLNVKNQKWKPVILAEGNGTISKSSLEDSHKKSHDKDHGMSGVILASILLGTFLHTSGIWGNLTADLDVYNSVCEYLAHLPEHVAEQLHEIKAMSKVSAQESLTLDTYQQATLEAFKGVYVDGVWLDNVCLSEKSIVDAAGVERTLQIFDTLNQSYYYINADYTIDESAFFDAVAYAEMHPDVANVIGTDKDALWQYYKNIGIFNNDAVRATTMSANTKLQMIEIAKQLFADREMADEEKVKILHDWICLNTTYDYNSAVTSEQIQAANSLERAITGSTICGGYSIEFSYFCHVLGIESEVIVGYAPTSTTTFAGHAWNRVSFDHGETWKYVDVTWDDRDFSAEGVAYDYYMISEEDYLLMNRIEEQKSDFFHITAPAMSQEGLSDMETAAKLDIDALLYGDERG